MLTFPEDEARATERTTLPGIPFLDAGPDQCRWPFWEADTDPQHFCGAPKRRGSSYCCEHARRAMADQSTSSFARLRSLTPMMLLCLGLASCVKPTAAPLPERPPAPVRVARVTDGPQQTTM